ncbi:MAG: ATP-binding protein [Bacilli bacterium]|nr:ATP-binding protein [Bacilli bacterium]
MLGHIVSIEDNTVIIDLDIDLKKEDNLLSHHAIMKDDKRSIIGEVVDIKNNQAYINLLGEIINDEFVFGVIRKPSFSSKVSLVSPDKINKIIGLDKYEEDKDLYIGESPIYDGVKLGVDIDLFFNSHFAVFGSTGSGKSCSVARIIQNLFSKKDPIPYRASIFLFDAYGEYHTAFSKLHEVVPQINFKTYTTNLGINDSELLRIPLWLLGVDDIALLLDADKHSQIPIIEKALKYVNLFANKDESVVKSKNDILARAILDILSSGRPAPQIRDQIFSVLTGYNTPELNLDTIIYQPGYSRPLKQCLLIDSSGKIRDMELVMNFMEGFLTEDYDLSLPDGTIMYTLNDLKDAFDFALISEGALKSDKIYDEANILKVRMHTLANSEVSAYFSYPEYVSKDSYIKKLLTADNGAKAQIINFNINYIDDRLAKNITKIYSKLLFDYAKGMEKRASLPFHIILEEAHRYVQNDNDKFLLGYNIFERITKEGRKYGVILGLISQRPSELSETSLSQCSNFLIFKMLHPTDVNYIKEMVPNITQEVVKRLRILQPGNCIAFGSAFKVPVLVRVDMPDPAPSSNSCEIGKMWFVNKK